jgi:hypothetical protein
MLQSPAKIAALHLRGALQRFSKRDRPHSRWCSMGGSTQDAACYVACLATSTAGHEIGLMQINPCVPAPLFTVPELAS